MQAEAPEAFDFSRESDATLNLYGLERGSTGGFGWQCLAARRLAERGVEIVWWKMDPATCRCSLAELEDLLRSDREDSS